MEKGKLPVTERLILESGKPEWQPLANRFVKEFKTSAIIKLDSDKKIRINLVINTIIPPEWTKITNSCRTTTNIEMMSDGLSRVNHFFNDYTRKTVWTFIGYIDGENKAPIIIVYFEEVNIFIYTQKLVNEDKKDFLRIANQN